MELVLAEKIPQGRDGKFLTELDRKLREISSGLAVNFGPIGLTKNRMPKLQVSGDDEEAFVEILRRSFGLTPNSNQDLLDQPICKGFVQKRDQENVILIDIGLRNYPQFQVTLKAERLRAQLFDGARIPLQDMTAKYGFLEDFPLELRVITCDSASRNIEVELSDRQRERLEEWRRLPLDRINIQDALDSEILSAVGRAGLERDIAGLETLSFGTHSLVCKLGTDGKGLVRNLGSQLEMARLFVFHPDSGSNSEARTSRNDRTMSSRRRNTSY